MAESSSSSGVTGRPTIVIPQISVHDTSQGSPNLRPVPHSAPVLSRQISEQPPHRPRLVHTLSRSQSYRQYIKKPLAAFFGVDDETEASSYQRWTERRKRLLSKRCGQLKKEYCQCPAPNDADGVGVISEVLPYIRDPYSKPWNRDQSSLSADVPDSASATSSVGAGPRVSTTHLAVPARRRKDSVAKMTWDGLNFLANCAVNGSLRNGVDAEFVTCCHTIAKKSTARRSQTTTDLHTSASIPRVGRPSTQRLHSYAPTTTTIDESVFYDDTPRLNFSRSPVIDEPVDHLVDDVFFDKTPTPEVTMSIMPPPFPTRKPDASPDDESEGGFTRLHEFRGLGQDDGTKRGWKRTPTPLKPPVQRHVPPDTRDGPEVGFKRIWTRLLDRAFDNSDRRQYGMGIVGRFLRRKFRKDRITSEVKDQLHDIDDHRPYFTYWLTTVQVLIFIISTSVYGLGPIGFHQTERQSLVLVTSLSLQQVAYFEPSNFWIGPRAVRFYFTLF
ncbi:Inactive rhomboid protein 1 [Nymphon striatum]|nr:Inactive rhomboid protein 1 [Nymphon striatum]